MSPKYDTLVFEPFPFGLIDPEIWREPAKVFEPFQTVDVGRIGAVLPGDDGMIDGIVNPEALAFEGLG